MFVHVTILIFLYVKEREIFILEESENDEY